MGHLIDMPLHILFSLSRLRMCDGGARERVYSCRWIKNFQYTTHEMK